ncbi:acid protease [Metschnikowia bicuspidata var. bicuspidata NRRL YB-4993]|uniref:candidapepsin n=1 Tax=Metschnikowia bicuspidata var. bicuspidata NRRL YB-4993 TaxID=869754 RepID=A0A1A0HB06_9ASCO|nr:acid protease [Metschnikowia bicuspidata var. bicuspidata NRRL YB-4993]OBA21309.1 acid protease [Metschnikowia bicuspidata var. bicuspidata NRRL YB-4993]
MLQLFTLLSLAAVLVQGLVVPELQARDSPAPLALDFSIQSSVGNLTVSEWRDKFAPKMSKRAYSEKISNVDYAYFLNVYLGSNRQKSNVLLDTGSSDLWVPTSDYNYKTSSTAKDTGHSFSIEYVDGSSAKGEYYKDTLTFDSGLPDVSLFEFAAASTDSFGVFGIADKDQESTRYTYDNFPWALQKAGITPKASYSLYLGEDHGTGVVIFGGIDTEKYEGSLTKYSIDTSDYALSLDVKTVKVGGKQVTENAPYVLDSGTSLALVSKELMSTLNDVFNVGSNGLVSCNQPSDEYLTFDFGENSIKVPYTDAVYSNGDGTCLLAFSYYEGYFILGDIFLRNAYVYYDLTDQTISLSQVKYSLASNIVAA